MKNNKKKTRTLTLAKETIAVLSTDDLRRVAGGEYWSKISICPDNPCTRW